jgi:hypothetical protein
VAINPTLKGTTVRNRAKVSQGAAQPRCPTPPDGVITTIAATAAAELARQSVELNKAAPEAPTSYTPTGVEPGKVLEGGPPKSDQTPDANRTPAESAISNKAEEAAAPVPIND